MKKKESNDTGMGLVLGLSLGHGIKHFGQGAISVIGPLLKVSLNLSDVAYGAIFSASNVASGLANIPAGILSDMYRKKIAWFLALSMLSIAIGYFLLGTIKIYPIIILSVVLMGFGQSFWHAPAFGTLAARYPNKKGFALSMHLTGAQIGNTIGPPIVGGLISGIVIRSIISFEGFGWEKVSVFITGLLVLILFKSAGSEAKGNWSFDEYKTRSKGILKDKIILGLILLGAVSASAHTSFLLFLAVYLKEVLNYSAFVIGFHIALITAAGIISTPIMGLLSDKYGRKLIIMIAMILMSIFLFLFLIFKTGIGLIVLMSLLGMFFFSVMPIITAATMDRVPTGSEGSGTALNFIGMSVVGFISPLFAGLIYSIFGFDGISIMSGTIAVFGVVLCGLLPIKRVG